MKKLVKRIGKLYFLLYMLLSIAGGLSLASCKNQVSEMLENTNKHFEVKDLPYDNSLIPGDEGFEQSGMLLETYYVGNRMSIALVAPKSKDYLWTLYFLEKTETAIWTGKDKVIQTEFLDFPLEKRKEQNFCFFVPEYDKLKVGTYKLWLQVVGYDDIVYEDTCELVIYDQYYLETMDD